MPIHQTIDGSEIIPIIHDGKNKAIQTNKVALFVKENSGINIVLEAGDSLEDVMSQNATTREIQNIRAYKGPKFNFDRDSFNTISDMKNSGTQDYPDGFTVFCKLDYLRYIYCGACRPSDSTGYWRNISPVIDYIEGELTEFDYYRPTGYGLWWEDRKIISSAIAERPKRIKLNGKQYESVNSIIDLGSVGQVLQSTGTDTTKGMSQDAVTKQLKLITDFLDVKFPFTITSFTGGKVVENGTSTTVSLTWSYDGTPTTLELKQGSTIISTLLTDRAKSLSGITGTNTDIIFTLTANSISRTTTVLFRNAKYVGNVDISPGSEGEVKALTKLAVTTSRSYTWNGSLNNNSVSYCYPVSFGALTSIKDSSGFEYLNGFTRLELTVNGENYYVYTSPRATASSFRYVFS